LSSTRKARGAREELLERLAQVGREHSDATVLFHTALARLLDLNPTDYKTMSLLERLGPLSAGELARHTGLASASVTDLIDRLERKGFVRRTSDPADRRRVVIAPIAARLAEARRHFESPARSLAALYRDYGTGELAVIAKFLSRNAERLRAETAKLGQEAAPARG
jgi:DNA-binding MarR family transcriptional regulator